MNTRGRVWPGSPWENGYCESFNGKLRDECLNGEIFYSLKEAQIVIENWRVEYNTKRPHSALGYRPPAPAACNPTSRVFDRRCLIFELTATRTAAPLQLLYPI